MLILKASALQMLMDRGRRSLKLFLVYSYKLPPPFGYSLLSRGRVAYSSTNLKQFLLLKP